MRKKVGVVFLICFFLSFFATFAFAQEGGSFGGAGASGNWESPDIFGINPESGIQLQEKWEYLGKEWKTILMRNAIVQAIDSFLQKISVVFSVLLGTSYSLSLAFFLTLILWIYLFLVLLNILGNTIFSKWAAAVISVGLAIGAAQLKLLQMPVNLIIGLFFGEKPWWVKLIIGAAIILIFVIILVLIRIFGKKFAENKQKMEDMKNRIKLGTGAKIGEKMSSIFKKH